MAVCVCVLINWLLVLCWYVVWTASSALHVEPKGDFESYGYSPCGKCNSLKLSKDGIMLWGVDFNYYSRKVLSTIQWNIISKVVKTITVTIITGIIIIIVVWWNSIIMEDGT